MDFDTILYIILIVGSILLSVVKTLKKDEGARQVKKMPSRPVEAETYEEEEVRPMKKRTRVTPQPEQNEEYFSYETMSERDFEQTFAQNAEEAKENLFKGSETPKTNLTLSEEEVFKGVVWSEILKRKY
jgi:hypothetical protein